MAYNPSLYSPYGPQQFQPTAGFSSAVNPTFTQQQPINGLVSVDSYKGVEMYNMPPNSVSPPLFLTSDNIFYIKTTDGGGAATVKAYRFEEYEMPSESHSDFVTKTDLEDFERRIMEAIDGKHTVPEPEQ